MPKTKDAKDASLNVKMNRKQREAFKKRCREQGVTIEQAIPVLLQRVVDGEIGFAPTETKLIVNQKKRR